MAIVLDGTTGITTPDIDSTQSTLGPLTQALNLGSTGQIQFPATQNPSSNANTLDDYEEGTWTPVFRFSGGSAGITYDQQLGRYTKLGRQVSVQCVIVLTSKGSSGGRVEIAGVPFIAVNDQYTAAVELRNVVFTQKYAVAEIGRAADNFFRVTLIESNATTAEMGDNQTTNTSSIFFTATYFTNT